MQVGLQYFVGFIFFISIINFIYLSRLNEYRTEQIEQMNRQINVPQSAIGFCTDSKRKQENKTIINV